MIVNYPNCRIKNELIEEYGLLSDVCKLISELESNNFHIKNKDKMIAKFALFVCVCEELVVV